MSDVEDILECTPPQVAELAKSAVEQLLPSKSTKVYEASYERFQKWCTTNKVENISENVLLAYFAELGKTLKSSTCWSHYSMIKSILSLKQNIDISKYLKLRALLKKLGEGYKPKKSKVLSKEEFDKFLAEAPDVKYLGTKVSNFFK